MQQLKRAGCLSYGVGQAFHGIWVNPGGRGVINNPADMWSGWGLGVSERACLNQCTALWYLWYLWYQSAGGSGGMQPLFPPNHNASGNVLSCSSTLGLFWDWTVVIRRTLCWQAALFHSLHLFYLFLLTTYNQKLYHLLYQTWNPFLPPIYFHRLLFTVKGFSTRGAIDSTRN